jgi:anti-sigma factor RsiW
MNADEPLLRAYVDGELDPARREQVEVLLAHRPDLQLTVDALRASCLPYRAAFDAQALPPVPDRLMQQVATYASLAQGRQAPSAAPSSQRRRAALRMSWGMGWGMAASFALGWAVPWRWTGPPTRQPNAPAWAQAIASYHALYVRATVGQQFDKPEQLASLLDGLQAEQQQRLAVPDLSSIGWTFRRVQRLGYEGRPLLQMVYLSAEGVPIAFCALPAAKVDGDQAPLQVDRLHGQTVAHWVDRGLAYVLVADLSPEVLADAARGLASGRFRRA